MPPTAHPHLRSRRSARRRRLLFRALPIAVLAAALAVVAAVVADRVASAPAGKTGTGAHVQPPLMRRLVALGDSVAAGTSCGCTPFITLAAQQLSHDQRVPVQADDLAVDGLTSARLLDQVATPAVRAQLAGADAVVITIGANDLEAMPLPTGCAALNPACFTLRLKQFQATLPRVVATVRAAASPRTRIVLTGYWNVFLDGVVGARKGAAYVANSDALTRAVNQTIAQTAAAAGELYLDTQDLFRNTHDGDDTTLLAADGDHPNAAGHALIARALVTELRAGGCRC